MASRTMLRLLTVLLLVTVSASVLRADVADFAVDREPAGGADLTRIKAIAVTALDELVASRKAIERGHFRLAEWRKEVNKDQAVETKITIDTRFDWPAELLRVQFKQTEPLPHPLAFTFVENTTEAFFWDQDGIFNIMKRGYLNEGHAHPPIDIRTTGAGFYYDHVMRGQMKTTIESVHEMITGKARLIGASREEGKVRIEYLPPVGDSARLRMVLDSTRDFIPIEVEAITQDRETKEWKSSQRTETVWQQVDGVWVPQTVHSKLTAPPRELTLNFEWVSVNVKLNPAAFTRDSFELPDGTYVADLTDDEKDPQLVEIIGQPTGERALSKESPLFRWILVGGSVALAVAVVGGWLVMRSRT